MNLHPQAGIECMTPANDAAPIVAIATSAGTGSEVDMASVITNEETQEKTGIFFPSMFPTLSVVDSNLIMISHEYFNFFAERKAAEEPMIRMAKAMGVENASSGKDFIRALDELVTAEKDGKVNTLTAGWGAFGNVWEKKTVTVYIRPQRYTKEFIDASGRFTMTFFEDSQKELLYLGSNSGRKVPDKIGKSGLHLTYVDRQPTYEEGKYVLVCKVLYSQPQEPKCFADPEFAEATFPDHDYSVMYVAEIEEAYEIEK